MPITKKALMHHIDSILQTFAESRKENEVYRLQCEALERIRDQVLSQGIPYIACIPLLKKAFTVAIDRIPHEHKQKMLALPGTPYDILARKLNGDSPCPTRYEVNSLEYIEYTHPGQAGLVFIEKVLDGCLPHHWETEHYYNSPQAEKDRKKAEKKRTVAPPAAAAAAAAEDDAAEGFSSVRLSGESSPAFAFGGGAAASASFEDFDANMPRSAPPRAAKKSLLAERSVDAAPVLAVSQGSISGDYFSLVRLEREAQSAVLAALDQGRLKAADLLPLTSKAGVSVTQDLNDILGDFKGALSKLFAYDVAREFMHTVQQVARRYLPVSSVNQEILYRWSSQARESIFTPDGLMRKLNDFWAHARSTTFSGVREDQEQDLSREFSELCVVFDLDTTLGHSIPVAHFLAYGQANTYGLTNFPKVLTEGFTHPKSFVSAKQEEYQQRLQELESDSSPRAATQRLYLEAMKQALIFYKLYGRAFSEKSLENPSLTIKLEDQPYLTTLERQGRSFIVRNNATEMTVPLISQGEFLALMEGGLIWETVVFKFLQGLMTKINQEFAVKRIGSETLRDWLGPAVFNKFLADLKAAVVTEFESLMLPGSRVHLTKGLGDQDLKDLSLPSDVTTSEFAYTDWLHMLEARFNILTKQIQLKRTGLQVEVVSWLGRLDQACREYRNAEKHTDQVRDSVLGLDRVQVIDFGADEEFIRQVLNASLQQLKRAQTPNLKDWQDFKELCSRLPGFLDREALARDLGVDLHSYQSDPRTAVLALQPSGPLARVQSEIVQLAATRLVDLSEAKKLLTRAFGVIEAYNAQQAERARVRIPIQDKLYSSRYPARAQESEAYIATVSQGLSELSDLALLERVFVDLCIIFNGRAKGRIESWLHVPLLISSLHENMESMVIIPLGRLLEHWKSAHRAQPGLERPAPARLGWSRSAQSRDAAAKGEATEKTRLLGSTEDLEL